MKMLKRNLAFMLALCMALSMTVGATDGQVDPADGELISEDGNAAPVVLDSGVFGDDNLTWTMTDDGVLTISGQGAMGDKIGSKLDPWSKHMSDIKKIVVEDGVTDIGARVFDNLSRLESITIPSSVKKISYYAISFCERLTEVNIAEGVEEIGMAAFIGSEALEEIVIPSTVKYIREYTFSGCEKLSRVVIPEGVVRIYDYAFFECIGLKSINIPASVTYIQWLAFDYCLNLKKVYFAGDAPAVKDWDFSKGTTIYYTPGTSGWTDSELYDAEAGTWDGYALKVWAKTMDSGVFGAEGDNLTWTMTEDGVLTIGGEGSMGEMGPNAAPWENYRAEILKIVMEPGVTTIGDWVFNSCINMTEVTIPEGVAEIGKDAFASCFALTEISIPRSVRTIGDYAFAYCAKLSNVKMERGLSSIGAYAFSSCKLTEVVLPSTLRQIGEGAFEICEYLESITIPVGVQEIGPCAFYYCTSLKEIVIPEGVTYIGYDTFLQCFQLERVTIPSTVTEIGLNAFRSCTSLTAIEVAEQNQFYTDVDGVLYASDLTALCWVPGGLQEYVVPAHVNSIGDSACRSLKNVYFEGNAPWLGDEVFAEDVTLYYLEGTEGWTTPTWNGYKAMPYTPTLRIVDVFVKDKNGVPTEDFTVGVLDVGVTLEKYAGRGTILVAAYTTDGQFLRMVKMTPGAVDKSEITVGNTINNTDGKIGSLRAFAVEDTQNMMPMCAAVDN